LLLKYPVAQYYRDLKPENVLLDQLGNVRLTDFGLSKEGVTDHSTGANSFCGTPEYIAPEVLLRQGHGRAVDWWSLGALLYEMITGLPPFYSRNRETMFEKIMKAELTFPNMMTEVSENLFKEYIQMLITIRFYVCFHFLSRVNKVTVLQDVYSFTRL
jgi:serine/threonine protein kinase